jgi:hypothetical protein
MHWSKETSSLGSFSRRGITLALSIVGETVTLLLLLTVTRPEEIPAALAQGKPVLIDIPAVQWRLRLLATAQAWGGDFAWWLVKHLAGLLLTQWLLGQGLSVGPSSISCDSPTTR